MSPPRRWILRNAELALRAARYDLATQVRNNYFAVLVAVENVKVSRALAELAENSYRIQIGRVRAAEAAPYEPLLLRVQAVQNRASLVQAQQAHAAAWRKLVAVLNWPELPLTPLVGSVDAPAPQISYQAALDRLLTCHTSLAVARNTIEKTRYQLEVARRTPVIPNVDVSAVLQHDYTTPPFNTVWSLNVGAPLPVWDQNRGNIMAAEAALIRASADVDRAANDLRNQLADAYNNYVTNEVTLKYYRTDMIVDQVLRVPSSLPALPRGPRQGRLCRRHRPTAAGPGNADHQLRADAGQPLAVDRDSRRAPPGGRPVANGSVASSRGDFRPQAARRRRADSPTAAPSLTRLAPSRRNSVAFRSAKEAFFRRAKGDEGIGYGKKGRLSQRACGRRETGASEYDPVEELATCSMRPAARGSGVRRLLLRRLPADTADGHLADLAKVRCRVP